MNFLNLSLMLMSLILWSCGGKTDSSSRTRQENTTVLGKDQSLNISDEEAASEAIKDTEAAAKEMEEYIAKVNADAVAAMKKAEEDAAKAIAEVKAEAEKLIAEMNSDTEQTGTEESTDDIPDEDNDTQDNENAISSDETSNTSTTAANTTTGSDTSTIVGNLSTQTGTVCDANATEGISGYRHQAYIKASDALANDEFGKSVAIHGDTMVVGVPNKDTNTGAVYVYKRTGLTWVQEAKITAPNAGPEDRFGQSVGISGDTIVIGAAYEGSDQNSITNHTNNSNDNLLYSGAAYVFKRTSNSWGLEAFIKAPNPGAGNLFGVSVGISGDTIVVGAPRQPSVMPVNTQTYPTDNSLNMSGAAYVFSRSGGVWSPQAFLKAPNISSYDSFGSSVAIAGDRLVVGSIGEDSIQKAPSSTAPSDGDSENSGAAYIFKRTNLVWSLESFLKPDNAELGDMFGAQVAMTHDTVVIGVPNEDSNQSSITSASSLDNSLANSGAVYVFRRNYSTWNQEAYIKASNARANINFGNSLSISGDRLVVGSWLEGSAQATINNNSTSPNDTGQPTSGAAYVYSRTQSQWSQVAYLKAPKAGSDFHGDGDLFGYSVGISGKTIVVTAYSEDSPQKAIIHGLCPLPEIEDRAFHAGAAYVFFDPDAPIYVEPTVASSPTWTGRKQYGVAGNFSTNSRGIKIDQSGNMIVTGTTTGALPSKVSDAGKIDAYLRKLNQDGTEAWTRQIGAPGAFDTRTIHMAMHSTGDIYVASETFGSVDGKPKISDSGRSDIFISKFASIGVKLWTVQLGIPGAQSLSMSNASNGIDTSLALDASGNVYLYASSAAAFDGIPKTSTQSETYIIKFNSDGVKQWAKSFGAAGSNYTLNGPIALDLSNNIIIGGYTSGTLEIKNSPADKNDGYIAKLDTAGSVLWIRQLSATNGHSSTLGIATDASGNIFVAGQTTGAIGTRVGSLGTNEGFIVKYDSSGTKQWVKQFGMANSTSQDIIPSGMTLDTSGNILVTGITDGAIDGNQRISPNNAYMECFATKYDALGVRIWSKQIGVVSTQNYCYGVATDSNGNIYINGDSTGVWSSKISGPGYTDAFIIKLDPLGAEL